MYGAHSLDSGRKDVRPRCPVAAVSGTSWFHAPSSLGTRSRPENQNNRADKAVTQTNEPPVLRSD